MDPHVFVPKNKFDTFGIPLLNQMSDAEILPAIPRLLEWIQDMNWPVAAEVVSLLAKHQSITEPELVRILHPDEKDSIWKYWIIAELLPRFEKPLSEELLAAVRRIAEHPNRDESLEEADLMAREYLTHYA